MLRSLKTMALMPVLYSLFFLYIGKPVSLGFGLRILMICLFLLYMNVWSKGVYAWILT